MKFNLLFSILLLITTSGCQYFSFREATSDEKPLARVENNYLYFSDIQSQYPTVLSGEDSVYWVNNIINNWVRQQLILSQAEKNLTDQQKDFSQQITDYRNSLLIYEYENRLLNKELDTAISIQEIHSYYNDHSDNFKLQRNIVKCIYFSVNAKSEKILKEAKKLFNEKNIDFQKLNFFCVEHQLNNCSLDTTKWLYFDELLSVIPIKTYNEDAFLRNSQRIDFSDGNWWYFACFFDYHLKSEAIPMELETDNIKNIILNSRKTELIRNIRQQIYTDAEQSGRFEIY
ncbi:MAG: hypothetical protein PHR53_01535 [Bacteroidales bacterium]|nr:hypothetical protein [Bacteroidales bacterium]